MNAKNDFQLIKTAAASSVAEVEYLLAQFWAFRRILGQARTAQQSLHPEDKLLTSCVLEALQRDLILGLCRLEDDKSKEGLRSCKAAIKQVYDQLKVNEFQKGIADLNAKLKTIDLKQSHRNKYIAHLNLPASEQPKTGPLESEIEDVINAVMELLESIGCRPNSSY